MHTQLRRTALGAVAVVALVLAVSAAAGRGVLERADIAIAQGLNDAARAHPALVAFWKVITTVGSPVVWDVLVAVVVVALCLRRRFLTAAAATAAVLGAAALSSALKVVIGRPRPMLDEPAAHAAGMSFPSGHALTSFVAAGVLVALVPPAIGRVARTWIAAVAAVVVIAVGFSRLLLGVHYLTDVLGAWCIGTLWLAAVWRLHSWGNDQPDPTAYGHHGAARDRRRGTTVAEHRGSASHGAS